MSFTSPDFNSAVAKCCSSFEFFRRTFAANLFRLTSIREGDVQEKLPKVPIQTHMNTKQIEGEPKPAPEKLIERRLPRPQPRRAPPPYAAHPRDPSSPK